MTTGAGIFADNAARYWGVGLPVIPLRPGEKRPAVGEWQRFSVGPVTEADRNYFLGKHAGGNIGLVLGQGSGLCMVDVDTDDPEIIDLIRKLLPASPWERSVARRA